MVFTGGCLGLSWGHFRPQGYPLGHCCGTLGATFRDLWWSFSESFSKRVLWDPFGGKGAKKFLWDDPIVPQILTDHSRSGSIIGAIGSALVVLVKASLVNGEIPLPQDEETRVELKNLNAVCIDTPVTRIDNIVLGQGADSAHHFSEQILSLMDG